MMAGGTTIFQSIPDLNNRDSTLVANSIDLGEHGVLECNLDPDLWERLPGSLIEKIVTKLPISSLFRLEIVCKSWRDLRSSILSSEISPRSGRLFVFSKDGELAGDLVVSEIESRRGVSGILPLGSLHSHFWLQDVVASTAGLLRFSAWIDGEFILYNPLTNCHRIVQMPSATLFYDLKSEFCAKALLCWHGGRLEN